MSRFTACLVFGLVAVFTLALGLTSASAAIPIPGLFNTGVDNSGNNLPFGSVDPHWALNTAPSGGPSAFVQNPRPGSWVPNTPSSQWIGSTANGNSSVPGGLYIYDLTFNLTGLDPTTAVITGDWASDNSSVIYLNGSNTFNTQPGFTSFNSFVLTSGFNATVNTLSIHVTNFSGPAGLHVTNLRGMANAIPEPATGLLALIGSAGLVMRRRR